MNPLGGAAIVMVAGLLSIAVLAGSPTGDGPEPGGFKVQSVELQQGSYLASVADVNYDKTRGRQRLAYHEEDDDDDGEEGPISTPTSNTVVLWVADEKSDKVFQYTEAV